MKGPLAVSLALYLVAGLLCNRFAPAAVTRARPLLATGSLLDTCVCVGGSLAPNGAATTSLLGLKVMLPVRPTLFHILSRVVV